MAQPRALIIFAKEPAPGKVKTRLAQQIGPERAARIYDHFIRQTLSMARQVPNATLFLSYTPPEAMQFFSVLAGHEFRLLVQEDGDLGSRMEAVFAQLFGMGMSRVIIIGTDSPTLPCDYVEEAFQILDDRDLVLGPALDGGYYLVALRNLHPELFHGIPWGTQDVLQQTLNTARKLKLSVSFLPPWSDVDTLADMERLGLADLY